MFYNSNGVVHVHSCVYSCSGNVSGWVWISQNLKKMFNLFWNVRAIAGGTPEKFRWRAAFGGMDTWLPKSWNIFLSQIFSQNHGNIFTLFWNPRAIVGPVPGERLSTAFGGRVGGLVGHLTSKEWKCFFLRYHVNIFTLLSDPSPIIGNACQ